VFYYKLLESAPWLKVRRRILYDNATVAEHTMKIFTCKHLIASAQPSPYMN
jgi:hypothetical protein